MNSLKEKTAIEKQINDQKVTVFENIQLITKVLNSKSEIEVRSYQNQVGEIEKNKLPIDCLNLKLKDLNNETEQLILFLENLSPEVFGKKIETNIQLIGVKIKDFKNEIEILTKKVTDNNIVSEKAKERLDEIPKDIKSISHYISYMYLK